MQIAGLAPSWVDASALGRPSESGQAASGQAEATTLDQPGSANGAMEILAKIVSRYDLHDITPRDFAEMLRRLRDAGVLSEGEYRDLAQIRIDLDEQNINADESIDLVDFCRKIPERLQRNDNSGNGGADGATLVDAAKRRLAWLEKVAVLQEYPESAGISQLV